MANNYAQMSESYRLTVKQVEWFREFLADCQRFVDGEDLDPTSPHGKRFLNLVDPDEGRDDLADLAQRALNHFTLEQDRTSLIWSVWVHHDEWVNIGVVVAVLQTMLAETESADVLSGTWSETCSKLKVGEFGGGWFAVSATKQRMGHTWNESKRAVEELLASE